MPANNRPEDIYPHPLLTALKPNQPKVYSFWRRAGYGKKKKHSGNDGNPAEPLRKQTKDLPLAQIIRNIVGAIPYTRCPIPDGAGWKETNSNQVRSAWCPIGPGIKEARSNANTILYSWSLVA